MVDDRTEETKDTGPNLAMIGAGIAVIVLILFVIANTKKTQVNFLIFRADNVSVWWVIVLTAVITLIGERLAGFAWRRRKASKNKRK
jgi:hypothetical protein